MSEIKTTDVRAAHAFDQMALAKYLASVLPDFGGALTVSQFASGQSNPTFLLQTGKDGSGAKYVLRKKPPGELLPSAHQVEREYRVMAALKATDVAVPEVLHLCQDTSVIGTNFFIMRYIDGRIFSHPSLPAVAKEERSAIYDAACDMLCRLHRVDVDAVALSDYGKRESFVARQLSRWTKQYIASKTEEIKEMDKVIEWLSANVPPGDAKGAGVTLVHGDYRLDNMIFHPHKAEVLAVLDWELSTLGNPASDLGYFSMLYHLPSQAPGVAGLAGLDLEALGIPSEHQFVEHYLRLINADWDKAALLTARQNDRAEPGEQRYFVIFSLFRLAAIAQGVYARAKQGVASAANAEAVGRMARPCAKMAWDLINQL